MKDRTGEELDGRYRLEKLMGEGGMGQVYEGTHLVTGRRVAIKFLLPELADNAEAVGRFYREARAATAIGSDHICEVLDMNPPESGSPFLVMEFLAGETLKERVQRLDQLQSGEAANIILQVLEALYAAHKAGIVHRDIKPENVFLVLRENKPPLVKLLDFGISKFSSNDGQDHSLTQTGTVLGTPYYMSPEQATGKDDVGPLSDLYAVGVMLYEILTGQVPFDADSFSALVIKIVTETPMHPSQLNPDVPEILGNLVLKSMAREKEARFQNAKEMTQALCSIATEQAISFNNNNTVDGSFEAVPTTGGNSGSLLKTFVQSGVSGVTQPSNGTGSGIVSMQNHTAFNVERSVQRDKRRKSGLFVGGGAVVAIFAVALMVGIYLLPQYDHEPSSVAAAEGARIPQPAVDLNDVPTKTPADTNDSTLDDGNNQQQRKNDDASESNISSKQPTEQQKSAKIHIFYHVQPPNATVYIDDIEVQNGSRGSIKLIADGEEHEIRASAPRHHSLMKTFTATKNESFTLVLNRKGVIKTPSRRKNKKLQQQARVKQQASEKQQQHSDQVKQQADNVQQNQANPFTNPEIRTPEQWRD